MKKIIEICDWCKDEKAIIKVKKGDNKGYVLCKECMNRWKNLVIEGMYDMYEEIEEVKNDNKKYKYEKR
jgi:transcription elongation factor Elf1